MPVYHVSTRINSNVPASSILYDLCIYRMDKNNGKSIIVDVKQQPFQGDYNTQIHATNNIDDPLSTIYIMEVTLYRKHMLNTHCVSSTSFTRMYTLKALSSGQAYSAVKRENPCYFETKGVTKLESEGENTVVVKISRPERPFIAEEYPIGDPRDPFEVNLIEGQINDRVNKVNFPNQNAASVCGPAAFFYCIQTDRPDVYAQAAQDLWRYGKTKIGDLDISPGDGCRHPSGSFIYDDGSQKISGLDWMTLAGLRDSENAVLSFDALDSPVSGITMWGTLSEWFEKAGYEKVFSNVGVTQAGIQGIRDLNDFVRKGYKVVTLINDGLLGSSDSKLTVPTHWIVWDGLVTEDTTGNVHLNLFSWGDVYDQIKTNNKISFFISRFFGGMVFKPLK